MFYNIRNSSYAIDVIRWDFIPYEEERTLHEGGKNHSGHLRKNIQNGTIFLDAKYKKVDVPNNKRISLEGKQNTYNLCYNATFSLHARMLEQILFKIERPCKNSLQVLSLH